MFDFIGRAAARLRDWRAREQAYAELMAMDDRSLADIGIRRSDIPYVLSTEASRQESLVSEPRVTAAANANQLRHAA
jgi:uncharacterized protein YjiS (DUF1127 family)